MKKITIVLLAVFFIGIANVNAQTEVKTTEETTEVKKACPHASKAECTPEEKAACSKDKSKCTKAKGEWSLEVADYAPRDSGRIRGWNIDLSL